MTDLTRLLENPVEAKAIVQKFVLLLVEHVDVSESDVTRSDVTRSDVIIPKVDDSPWV
jgi:hypothetical protein